MIKGKPLLVIASSNIYKARELALMLKGVPVKATLLHNAETKLEGTESGGDYETNAIAKAHRAAQLSGKMALGEDSGLEVNSLQGQPGPMSARFVSADATSAEKVQALLERLKDLPQQERAARFVSVIALAQPSGEVLTFRGECSGMIADEAKGNGGFGYDPVFIPDGHDMTFAELGGKVKNKVSHRAEAMAKVREHLRSVLTS